MSIALCILIVLAVVIVWRQWKINTAINDLGVITKAGEVRLAGLVEAAGKSVVSAVCSTLSSDLRAAIVANGAVLNRHADERHADVKQLHQAHAGHIASLSEHVTNAHKCAGDDRIRVMDSVNAITKLLRPEDFPQGRYVERNSDV